MKTAHAKRHTKTGQTGGAKKYRHAKVPAMKGKCPGGPIT